jgi:hypothetical protein
MKNFYALEPQYDSRLSFYGKAHVIVEDNGDLTLRSYSTDILTLKTNGKVVKLWDDWSQTTGRHIVEFCRQHHIRVKNKRDYDDLPLNEEF